jgi:carbon monoxide dehydrogenase subunit G
MPTAERSAVFDSTTDAAWSVVSDLARFSDWFVMHEGFTADPPKVEAGAKFSQRTRLLGMPAQVSWTIESVDPGRSYTMVGIGTLGIQVKAETTVSPVDGETTVTIKLSFEGGMLAGSISATVEKEVTGKLDDSLAKLRTVLAG